MIRVEQDVKELLLLACILVQGWLGVSVKLFGSRSVLWLEPNPALHRTVCAKDIPSCKCLLHLALDTPKKHLVSPTKRETK